MSLNFFSRRQQWRRTIIRHKREWGQSEVKHNLPYEDDEMFQKDGEYSLTAATSDISTESLDQRNDSSDSLDDTVHIDSSSVPNVTPHNVKFNPDPQIFLVPSRKDYGPQLKDLYWHQEDYDLFKQDAVGEIRMYWRLSGTSAKEAIVALYQPEYDQTELVISVLYKNRSNLSIPPSPMRFDETLDSFIIEEDDESEKVVIEGTVMRHVDSLSSFQQHGFEDDSDSASTSSLSTITEYKMQGFSISPSNSSPPVPYYDMDGVPYENSVHLQFQHLHYQQSHLQLHQQNSLYKSHPSHLQNHHSDNQRVAHGGVWIDSEGDSDSLISDSMDYDI